MSAHSSGGIFGKIREYSLPLIVGVFAALAAANWDYEAYHHWVDGVALPFKILGHPVTLHFFINDIFMVFFFGVATKEITDAVLPGGALNPMKKAINPLVGTLGGVFGPVGVYFALTYLWVEDPATREAVANGWGVPTATDIALAWLCARMVFGAKHSAVSFLLLLAIADDAIGLGIIAVFYPDPVHPVAPLNLAWVAGAMLVALAMRKRDVRAWWPYILIAGGISWYGLMMAHLHPALALVFIVPFLPSTEPTEGLISEEEAERLTAAERARPPRVPLSDFEHAVKPSVDWGLFLFAFCNAGVQFGAIGTPTWIVLASLAIGKTLGITLFSGLAVLIGFPLPAGMDMRSLATAGLVAGIGLTVALFVCGVAFTDPVLQGEAKMGALLSGGVFLAAVVVGKLLRIQRVTTDTTPLAGRGENGPAH